MKKLFFIAFSAIALNSYAGVGKPFLKTLKPLPPCTVTRCVTTNSFFYCTYTNVATDFTVTGCHTETGPTCQNASDLAMTGAIQKMNDQRTALLATLSQGCKPTPPPILN